VVTGIASASRSRRPRTTARSLSEVARTPVSLRSSAWARRQASTASRAAARGLLVLALLGQQIALLLECHRKGQALVGAFGGELAAVMNSLAREAQGLFGIGFFLVLVHVAGVDRAEASAVLDQEVVSDHHDEQAGGGQGMTVLPARDPGDGTCQGAEHPHQCCAPAQIKHDGCFVRLTRHGSPSAAPVVDLDAPIGAKVPPDGVLLWSTQSPGSALARV